MKILRFIILNVCITLIIFLYFLFLNIIYIYPNYSQVPILEYIGFFIIIFCVILLFIMISKGSDYSIKIINLKTFNESKFKNVVLILIFISLIIPPVSFTESIMDWNAIPPLSYLRAVIMLIVCLVFPGISLYNIFFRNFDLDKKLFSPFVFKSTVYPLLSITTLGIYTLILDQIGLQKDFFFIFYLILIMLLFFIDKAIVNNKDNIRNKQNGLKLSKIDLIFIFIIIGIALIVLGIHEKSQFLIPGDSWRGINYAVLVGNENTSYLEKFYTYEILYGCITFSYSILTGIPYINVNVLMQILLYLNLSSIYLLVRSILKNFETIYSQLTTILIIIFSELFYFTNPELGFSIAYWFTYDGIFCFRYKGLSYFLLFTSLALFISPVRRADKDHKLTLLSSWFFLNSLLIYYLPIIPGILMIILFLYFNWKKQFTSHFLIFLIFCVICFTLIDLTTTFFFSWNISAYLRYFLHLDDLNIYTQLISNAVIVYILFTALIIILYLFSLIYRRYFVFKKYKYRLYNSKFLILYLGVFGAFLLLEIFINIIFKVEYNFLTYILHLFFSNIGFIGIIGIYLSIQTYKEDRILFYHLLLWFIFIIFIAFFLIILRGFEYPNINPLEIPSEKVYYMNYWFNRIWFYSIIPLSIFASIGIVTFFKKLNLKLSKSLNKASIGIFLSSMIVFFSLTNTIVAGVHFYNINYYVKNDEAQIIGWVSENTPEDSSFLINRWSLYYFFSDITFRKSYNIKFEIFEAVEKYGYFDYSKSISPNCSLSLIKKSYDRINIIELMDQNHNGKIELDFLISQTQNNGSISFDLKIGSLSNFTFEFLGVENKTIFNLHILNNSLMYDFNSSLLKISDFLINTWYEIEIRFNPLDLLFNVLINNTNYGTYTFINNITLINRINFNSGLNTSISNIYLDNFSLSWIPNFYLEYCLFPSNMIFDCLREKDINYLIISSENEYFKNEAQRYIDIYDDLIPNFYKKKLYHYGNLSVYFANESI